MLSKAFRALRYALGNDVEVTRSEITLSCNSRACKSGPQDLNVCLYVHLPALPVSVCLCYHAMGNFEIKFSPRMINQNSKNLNQPPF